MSNSVWPHRRQPTRLPHPWDSPGKNTGVGCHFLLQCMKVKSESESEVAQSCPTLSDPMDYSLPGSSIHGIYQARVLEWGAIAFSENTVYHRPTLNNIDPENYIYAERLFFMPWSLTQNTVTGLPWVAPSVTSPSWVFLKHSKQLSFSGLCRRVHLLQIVWGTVSAFLLFSLSWCSRRRANPLVIKQWSTHSMLMTYKAAKSFITQFLMVLKGRKWIYLNVVCVLNGKRWLYIDAVYMFGKRVKYL